jgi:hypothetical protein
MTQLIGEIKRLEPSWSEVDTQISSALRSIGASMSGPGLLKDIGFQIGQQAPDLQRRLDLIVATQKIGLDKGVVWADETLWVSSSPASGAAAAKSIADQLRKARTDTATIGGQEALNHETLDLLEKHQNDPYFAVAFAKEVPPQELKALLGDLYFSVRHSLQKDREGPPSSDLDRLAVALSVTLGTASRGVGDMKLSKGYADELIATDGDVATGLMVDKLLRYGTFDDAFLLDVANKVFDNAHKPQAEQQQIIDFRSGLAAALANNPRVAQDFFTDPARKPLAFLMRENYWGSGSRGLGRAIEAATTTYRDNGQPPGSSRGYKSALIASWAVHFWADPRAQAFLPDTRQSAAHVFAAYMSDVHRISGSSNRESMGVTPLKDTDPNLPGSQPYGALFDRETAKNAMTWAFKDPHALKTVVEAHGEYSVKVFDAQGAQIKDKINTAFTEWRSSHPNATEAEQRAYRQKLLTDGMAGSIGDLFNARVYDLSKSLHFAIDSGNLANIKEADRRDEANKALKDAFTRTLKLALTPAGDWVVAGYEYAEENISDNIKFTEGKAARSKSVDTLVESQNLFKDLTANAMMRHGVFGDESTLGTAHPHAFANYAKKSEGDFVVDGRIIPRSQMDSTKAYAYDEWLKRSPASGIFRKTDQSVWEGFQRAVPSYPEAEE